MDKSYHWPIVTFFIIVSCGVLVLSYNLSTFSTTKRNKHFTSYCNISTTHIIVCVSVCLFYHFIFVCQVCACTESQKSFRREEWDDLSLMSSSGWNKDWQLTFQVSQSKSNSIHVHSPIFLLRLFSVPPTFSSFLRLKHWAKNSCDWLRYL